MICGETRFSRAIPFSKAVVPPILGPEPCLFQIVAGSSLPFSLFKLVNKWTTSTITVMARSFKHSIAQLKRNACWTKGCQPLASRSSEQIDGCRVALSSTPPPCGANFWSKAFPLKMQILCAMWVMVRLRGNGDPVKIQRKRERKCRKRGVRIKNIQNGLKRKHETKTVIQNGDITCPCLWACWDGRVSEFSATQKGDGRRLVR